MVYPDGKARVEINKRIYKNNKLCVQNADIPNININVTLLDIIVVYKVKVDSGFKAMTVC